MNAELQIGYLDPGAGSILLQLLVGGLLGVGIFFRRSIASLSRIFRRGDRLSTDQPPANLG